jgi:protein-disulfide isomerase
MTAADKTAVEAIIRDYLINHPEILSEALDAVETHKKYLETREILDAIAKNRDALEGNEADFIAGNPKGDVTIVEFFDYNCSFCKRVLDSVLQLIEQDSKIRVVFKEMPILDDSSIIASRAALAARHQGKYMPFHLAMMRSRGAFDETRVMEIAQSVGLNVRQLRKDMEDDGVKEALKANYELAADLKVNGTPAFVIGDQIVPGAIGLERMQELVAEARKQCATC